MSECDISKCIVCKNFDSQSKEIKRLKKELKVIERRGRVEELNKIIELVNGETFDHYPELDSGLVFDKFEFMNYLEKRLLKLQGVEK